MDTPTLQRLALLQMLEEKEERMLNAQQQLRQLEDLDAMLEQLIGQDD